MEPQGPPSQYETVFTNAKAGMEEVDRERGTPHFENEQRKMAVVEERVARMQQQAKAMTAAELAGHERAADALVAEMEAAERDLSRTWLHVDMDAFYAACEQRDDPSLAGKPFAVGGIGMISTASYVARKFGVRSAMPGFIAQKLCPQLIFVQPNFEKYQAACSVTRSVFAQFDPAYEAGSMDEAYLDVTDHCAAQGISGSQVGVAPNRMLAKIASDVHKPNGQFVIPADRKAILEYMRELEVRKIPGVGRVTAHIIRGVLGATTCGEVLNQRGRLSALFTPTQRDFLLHAALGLGHTRHPEGPHEGEVSRRGISCERTFKSTGDRRALEARLREVAAHLADDMAAEGLRGKTIMLKLKAATFELRTRAATLDRFVCSADELATAGLKLLHAELPMCVRLLGLRVSNFKSAAREPGQRSLEEVLQRRQQCQQQQQQREQQQAHQQDAKEKGEQLEAEWAGEAAEGVDEQQHMSQLLSASDLVELTFREWEQAGQEDEPTGGTSPGDGPAGAPEVSLPPSLAASPATVKRFEADAAAAAARQQGGGSIVQPFPAPPTVLDMALRRAAQQQQARQQAEGPQQQQVGARGEGWKPEWEQDMDAQVGQLADPSDRDQEEGQAQQDAPPGEQETPGSWACEHCTFLNAKLYFRCEMCGQARAVATAVKIGSGRGRGGSSAGSGRGGQGHGGGRGRKRKASSAGSGRNPSILKFYDRLPPKDSDDEEDEVYDVHAQAQAQEQEQQQQQQQQDDGLPPESPMHPGEAHEDFHLAQKLQKEEDRWRPLYELRLGAGGPHKQQQAVHQGGGGKAKRGSIAALLARVKVSALPDEVLDLLFSLVPRRDWNVLCLVGACRGLGCRGFKWWCPQRVGLSEWCYGSPGASCVGAHSARRNRAMLQLALAKLRELELSTKRCDKAGDQDLFKTLINDERSDMWDCELVLAMLERQGGLGAGVLEALGQVQHAPALQAGWKARLSGAVRGLVDALLDAAQEGGPLLVGLREAVVQRRRQLDRWPPQQPLSLEAADAQALLLRVARGPLGLLPEGRAGAAPASTAPGRHGSDLEWSVAKHTVGLAVDAGLVPAAQAADLARGACRTVDLALRPIRQPEGGGSNSGSAHRRGALPTLFFISAAARVAGTAASGACGVGDGTAADQVVDTLLSLVEDCCSVAAELGVGDRVAGAVLRTAAAAARELPLPLTTCLAGQRAALPDLLARLQPLLSASAELAELEFFLPAGGSGSPRGPWPAVPHEPLAKVEALWLWDLTQDLSAPAAAAVASVAAASAANSSARGGRDPCHALVLCRTLVEVTATVLAAAWRVQGTELKGVFVPLASSAAERPVMMLVLTRLGALVAGDDALCRFLLPLLTDMLAGQTAGADAAAYAVAAHSLASLALVCAAEGRRWGYDLVVDLLLKLYKFPQFSISRALLYGTPGTGATAAAQAAAAGVPTAGPSAGADVPISGRCPGALAAALERLARGVAEGAGPFFRTDLRIRLLALFSDFGLILPGESYLRDLGSLLPAVAAVAASPALGDSGLGSASLTSAELSLDNLQALQERDLLLLKLFRQLWLYAGVYDFGGLLPPSQRAHAWPAAWQAPLGQLAAVSPVLLLGMEQQRGVDLQEQLQSEFGARLAKLGARGSLAALTAALTALAGPAGPALTAPLAAHVLTIAAKGLCRARFCGSEWFAREEALPIKPVLAHLQLSMPTAPEYPWLQNSLTKSFVLYTSRMMATRAATRDPAVQDALDASAQLLAATLAANLVLQGRNHKVRHVADRLLGQLFDSFPALQFKPAVLSALLRAAADEDASVEDGHRLRLAWGWTVRLMQRAAEIAPGPTEALVVEHMRRVMGERGRVAEVVGAYMPEVLQSVRTARGRFAMAGLYSGPLKGLLAWSSKMSFLGRVGGLAEGVARRIEGEEGAPTEAAALACARMLAGAARCGERGRALVDLYLQAAAALALAPASLAAPQLLRLLCWVPTKRFGAQLLEAAAVCWHWAMAVAGAETQLGVLEEVTEAWLFTLRDRMGLFSPALDAAPCTSAAAPFPLATNGEGAPGQLDGGIGAGVAPEEGGNSLDGMRAHHLWIRFYWEVWQTLQHDLSSTQAAAARTYGRLLEQTLRAPDTFSGHAATAGPRFRLLSLALQYCGAQQAAAEAAAPGSGCPPDVALLYERVLLAGLLWFAEPLGWHDSDAAGAREAAAAAHDFLARVRRVTAWPAVTPPGAGRPHPVWGDTPAAATASNAPRQQLLLLLLEAEAERLGVWADPLATGGGGGGSAAAAAPAPAPVAPTGTQWVQHVRVAWDMSPRLAVALQQRFPATQAVREQLERLVGEGAADPALQGVPEAVTLLATCAAAASRAPQLQYLAVWAPLPLQEAMPLLSSPAGRHPQVLAYLLRSLQSCPPEEVAFFLPQLVQLLRFDGGAGVAGGQVERYLLDAAQASVVFAHLLACQLASEGTPPEDAFNPTVKRSGWTPPSDTGLWAIADRVHKRLLEELHGPVRERLLAELSFFDEVTAVSGKLYPVPKEERKSAAVKFLSEIALPRDDLYIPTNPDCHVLAIIPESAAPMQSAAKCPILAAFRVEQAPSAAAGHAAPVEKVQACIFKVGDDCRQDVLALQVIALLKRQFESAGLRLHLVPYGVVPTGHEQGIIEVVPHAKSRAQLGEVTDGGLFEVFQHEFGMPGSRRFEAARANFIASMAGYAVASYILQAKDRHNGNIMLDNKGHVVHIDFGYILGISPGGNLGFESAAFKLSYEMAQLLDPGGTRASEHFKRFVDLCVRGFLAARTIAPTIVATVAMMQPSQLPCFGYGRPIPALAVRFRPELSDAAAAALMRGLISDAYDKWTTGFYDYVQYLQNRIPK
eukprot:scaffold21.g2072.t1